MAKTPTETPRLDEPRLDGLDELIRHDKVKIAMPILENKMRHDETNLPLHTSSTRQHAN